MDDLRESPSSLIRFLYDRGANINYCDPYFNTIPKTRKFKLKIDRCLLTSNILSSMDLVLLATDHDDFDYDLILEYSKIIVDTRGRFKKTDEKIIKA